MRRTDAGPHFSAGPSKFPKNCCSLQLQAFCYGVSAAGAGCTVQQWLRATSVDWWYGIIPFKFIQSRGIIMSCHNPWCESNSPSSVTRHAGYVSGSNLSWRVEPVSSTPLFSWRDLGLWYYPLATNKTIPIQCVVIFNSYASYYQRVTPENQFSVAVCYEISILRLFPNA